MDNTTEENVIFLKDLIFTALRRWKVALLAGLILAVLLGGYRAFSDRGSITTATQNDESYALQMEQYEATMKILEETSVKQQKAIESQQEYMTNSVFMELDPFDHYQVNFSIYVDVGMPEQLGNTFQSADQTNYILSAYRAKFSSVQTAQYLADAVGIETLYLSELCTVKLPENSSLLTITIVYPTEEGAKILLKELTTQFYLFRDQITQNIYDHNAQVLEESVCRFADPELVTKQSAAETYLQELQEAQAQTQAELAALTPPTAPGASVSSYLKKVLIFAVIGGIAGVGLVAIYAWVEMIASQKVYSSRSLRARTGVKVLGCVCQKLPKNGIDRFLLRLEGRDFSEPEARAAVLARDVRNRCEGVARLLITGDMDAQQRAFVTDALKQAMPGVQICDHGSILRCADAVDALRDSDKVLLVEQCGSSRYNSIASECQKVADYGKEVLGCILLGG